MENNDTVPTMPSPTRPQQESRTTLGGDGELTKQRLSESDQSLTLSAKNSDRKSDIAASMIKFLGEDERSDLDGYSVGKASERSHSSSVQQRRSSTSTAGCASPVKSIRKNSSKKSKLSSTDNNVDGIKTRPRNRSGTNSSTGKKNKDRLSTGEHKSLSAKQASKEGDNDFTNKMEEINRNEKPKKRDSRSVASTQSKNNKKNLVSENDETFGEDTLNDQTSIGPGKSMRLTAKNLLDRAVRAASPGRLRRAASPGRLRRSSSKIKSSMRSKSNNIRARSISPDNSDTKSTKNTTKSSKQHPKSHGQLKKRIEREGSGGRTKSKSKKRAESPGALKKRSESPGRLKKRAARKASTARLNDNNETLGVMLDKDAATKSKRRVSRSVASAPMKKPQRQKSNDGLPQQKLQSEEAMEDNNYDDDKEESSIESSQNARDEMPSKPRRSSTESSSPDGTGTLIIKESYSNMKNKLTRHKMRRNKSMAPSPSPAYNSAASEKEKSYSDMKNELARQKIRRNKSMTPSPSPAHNSADTVKRDNDDTDKVDELARYKIRRNKSMNPSHREGRGRGLTSPADLVQYTEEEIHSTSYFASNHVLINRERMKRGLIPLTRNIAMDDVARKSALAMAESNGLNPLPATYVGNVLRGESIRSIHRSTMLQKQGRERENLLNPYFQDFGVATAKGDDGMLYMCQLFSERLELALTDTVSEQNEPKPS